MHLVRNTYGANFIFLKRKFVVEQTGCLHQFLPPVFRILFCKTRLRCVYFHF